ncbi:hypothetical protein GOP47_0003369 [Adiantum capillus-veneris]|uniref:Flowering-promoting factor 1-like protein 3 n=1 Tax=Adiantum capillus-veneris TaxID=13818 RepID=A0A9D4VBU8_ADICA|nr:hypothetical protein GOP47_0003369 [Adiantum capillus-veneris]
MGGVWYFGNDGVARLVSEEAGERGKVLVYHPTNEAIRSYAELQQKLALLGWRRYPNEQPGTLQFHKGPSSNHLITLPSDFRCFRMRHMLDIIMKNRDYFVIRDA